MRLLNRVMKITRLSRENRELKNKIIELTEVKESKEDKIYRVSYSAYIFFNCVGSPIDLSFTTKDISQETINIHFEKIRNEHDNKICITRITSIEEITNAEVKDLYEEIM
ncbi:MAG: hypothetical protein ACRC1T_08900 [Clostridium chrysemydis]|uniref:hypothetical protein n=1 Tax=Clostridium chrysemydis TaxID=2665504 RepID=UPI003F2FBF31